MTLGDVSAIVFLVIAMLIAMPCITVMFGVFAPRLASRAEARVARHPVLTFLAGLPATGFVLALAAGLGSAPAPAAKFVAAVIGLAGGLTALAGLGGIAGAIGRATPSPVDRERPWRAVVRGAVILELACVFPLVGWLLVYPVALVTGMGAAALSLIPVRAARPQPQAEPAPHIPMAQPAYAVAGPEEVSHR